MQVRGRMPRRREPTQPVLLPLRCLPACWLPPRGRKRGQKRGLQVHRPTPEQMKEWTALAEQLYPRIRGTMVPAETFDEVMAHLKAYRAGKGK